MAGCLLGIQAIVWITNDIVIIEIINEAWQNMLMR